MEMIDIYDELGQKTGVVMEKSEVHLKGFIHKSICVWIINSNNEILLQKRGAHVMFPNMWDISCSGHVKSGESSLEAVTRETKEELGIEIDQTRLRYLFSCRVSGMVNGYCENEIDDVFLYQEDIPIEAYHFSDQEVQSVEYISLEEFKMMVERNDTSLMPYELHYHYLLKFLESELYERNV